MLDLVFHGGQCCAIKTIKGFDWCKYSCANQEAVTASNKRNQDVLGNHVRSDLSFFTDEAPHETLPQRFDRLVKFCKRERPQGVIEVSLAEMRSSDSYNQVKTWEPMLLEYGFKVTVPRFLNSNSNNYVTIYHLVYDAHEEKKAAVDESAIDANVARIIADPFRRL